MPVLSAAGGHVGSFCEGLVFLYRWKCGALVCGAEDAKLVCVCTFAPLDEGFFRSAIAGRRGKIGRPRSRS